MKRFIIRSIIFSLPFILLIANYLLLLATREKSGDLGKMSDLFFEKGYHHHIDQSSILPFFQSQCRAVSPREPQPPIHSNTDIAAIPPNSNIIVFGDSFSNTTPYRYQQAIEEKLKLPVLNIHYNLKYAPEEAAYNYLRQTPQCNLPKIIIVECVERDCIPRLFWLNTDIPFDSLQTGKKNSTATQKKAPHIEMLNYYQHLFTKPNIIITALDIPAFSCKGNEQILYSYHEDTIHYSQQMVAGAVENLNKLHSLAEAKDVKLIYLVAPNKSSVYAGHAAPFFSVLDDGLTFDTLPYALNMLDEFRHMVNNGQKDLYYADDSHWSPQTARLTGIALAELIENYDNNN